MTKTNDPKKVSDAVDKVFTHENVDLVVHNDLNQIKSSKHQFNAYLKNKRPEKGIYLGELVQLINKKILTHSNNNSTKEVQV